MNIPIELILKLIGGLGALLAVFLGYNKIKQSGRDELSRETLELNLQNLLQNKKKTEEIRERNASDKSKIPNDWDSIDKLRSKGARSLDEMANAGVRKEK